MSLSPHIHQSYENIRIQWQSSVVQTDWNFIDSRKNPIKKSTKFSYGIRFVIISATAKELSQQRFVVICQTAEQQHQSK